MENGDQRIEAQESPPNIEEFLKLCEKASSRSRNVLIGLIFVTVILFGGTWKQLSQSWFEVDVQRWEQAQQYIALKNEGEKNARESQVCDDMQDILREAQDELACAQCDLSAAYKIRLLEPQKSCGEIAAKDIDDLLKAQSSIGCQGKDCSKVTTDKPGQEKKGPATGGAKGVFILTNADSKRYWLLTTRKIEKRHKELESQAKLIKKRLDDAEPPGVGKLVVEKELGGPIADSPEVMLKLIETTVSAKLNNSLRLRDENELLVHIPTFGIAFHINDLGILGGFGAFVLLLWMRASLDEEQSGLQATESEMLVYLRIKYSTIVAPDPKDEKRLKEFGDAVKVFLTSMYRRLSMQQFFFRPQSLESEKPAFSPYPESVGSKALRYAALLLLTSPVIFEATLFVVDYQADTLIFLENRTGYRATLILSGAFLSVNAILTYFALRSAFGQVEFWRKLARLVVRKWTEQDLYEYEILNKKR